MGRATASGSWTRTMAVVEQAQAANTMTHWYLLEKLVFSNLSPYGLKEVLLYEDHLVPFRIVEKQRLLAAENAQTAQFSEDSALRTRQLYTSMSQKATRTGVAATNSNTQTASSWNSPTTSFNGRQTASSWMRSTQRRRTEETSRSKRQVTDSSE